jgi:hypothetical protein
MVRALVVLLVCSWGSLARADWFLGEESRTLAQHRYLPPMLAESAFITSHVGTRLGFLSLKVPGVVTNGRRRDLRASGLTQTFDVGVKLYDLVGLYGTAQGSVKSGIDAGSAFELGAGLDASFQLGGVVRLLRLPQLGSELSVRIAGGLALHNTFNVKPFVDATVAGRPNLSLLVTPARSRQVVASFHFAQTIVESVGLQTAVTLRGSKATLRPFDGAAGARLDVKRDDFTVDVSFALSFDAARFGVPVALMPEYQVARQSLTSRSRGSKVDFSYRTQRIGGGLYYTGREDLVLGVGALVALHLEQDRLEWSAVDGSRQRSGSPSEVQANFTLRYVW